MVRTSVLVHGLFHERAGGVAVLDGDPVVGPLKIDLDLDVLLSLEQLLDAPTDVVLDLLLVLDAAGPVERRDDERCCRSGAEGGFAAVPNTVCDGQHEGDLLVRVEDGRHVVVVAPRHLVGDDLADGFLDDLGLVVATDCLLDVFGRCPHLDSGHWSKPPKIIHGWLPWQVTSVK